MSRCQTAAGCQIQYPPIPGISCFLLTPLGDAQSAGHQMSLDKTWTEVNTSAARSVPEDVYLKNDPGSHAHAWNSSSPVST